MGIFNFGQKTSTINFLDMFNSTFYTFGEEKLNNPIVRSSIDFIANSIAKSELTHIRPRKDGTNEILNSDTLKVIQNPNSYQNSFAFLYRLISELYINNNAFVYVKYNGFTPSEMHVINCNTVKLTEKNNEIYATFQLDYCSSSLTAPYNDLIHIRRHYNSNVFYADDSYECLQELLETNSVMNQGIQNLIKLSSQLKVIMKFTSVLKEADMKAKVEEFTEKYLQDGNGVAGLDAKADLQPLSITPSMVDPNVIIEKKKELYSFFGVTEQLVNGSAPDSEVQNYYDQVVNPLLKQLSEEFTKKLFTKTERGYGNKIIFSAQSMLFASLGTKTTMIKELMQLGILNVNEARVILGLPPIDGGERRLQSLNFVNQEFVDSYQLSKVTDGNTEPVNPNAKGGDTSEEGN